VDFLQVEVLLWIFLVSILDGLSVPTTSRWIHSGRFHFKSKYGYEGELLVTRVGPSGLIAKELFSAEICWIRSRIPGL
jgi:hypothetical protein